MLVRAEEETLAKTQSRQKSPLRLRAFARNDPFSAFFLPATLSNAILPAFPAAVIGCVPEIIIRSIEIFYQADEYKMKLAKIFAVVWALATGIFLIFGVIGTVDVAEKYAAHAKNSTAVFQSVLWALFSTGSQCFLIAGLTFLGFRICLKKIKNN